MDGPELGEAGRDSDDSAGEGSPGDDTELVSPEDLAKRREEDLLKALLGFSPYKPNTQWVRDDGTAEQGGTEGGD